MTTHEHLSTEILADYAEGLLGDADATAAADHLADCGDCRADQELLASVSTILAADDPGPMPAHFAARIDAALADLAAAEPVSPKSRTTAAASSSEGAKVIDLASRRRFAGGARVTSIAASLVLVIGGAAIGTQVLNSDDSENPETPLAIGPSADPTFDSARYAAYAMRAKETPKGANAVKGKNGAVVDKRDGTVYLKNKVFFPDGTVVRKKKTGDVEVQVTEVTRTGTVQKMQTFKAPKPSTTAPTTGPTTPESPASTPPPVVEPEVTTAPPAVASAKPSVAGGYVYTSENFATRVMELLQESGNFGAPEVAEPDPATANSEDQNRVLSGAVRSVDDTAGENDDSAATPSARVKRCATQLGLKGLLVGEAGTWKKQDVTVVVVQNPSDAEGVIGYVVQGDCTPEDRATPEKVIWQQNVDKPAAEDPKPVENPTETATRSTEQ